MAKLFAAAYFDTPWLFHLTYAKSAGVALSFVPGSNSRPDLIGLTNTGDWIVMEAKGRSRGFSADALSKAKTQTTMVNSINGVPPVLSVALQSYFQGTRLQVKLEDPPERDPKALDVDLDVTTAMRRYYGMAAAITNLPGEERTVDDRRYVTRFDRDSGITIGIDRTLLDLLDAGKTDEIQRATRGETGHSIAEGTNARAYPDGLFITLDERWSEVQMHKEPDSRGGG